MDTRKLYRIQRRDLRKASLVLGKAFYDDPHFVQIMPDPAYREDRIFLLFRSFLSFGILYGEAYAPTSEIEGVSVWVRSKDYFINAGRLIRSGFLRLLWQIDRETLKRLRQYGDQVQCMHDEAAPFEHWYLWILGVSPENRRKGLARRMIEAMLERIDEDGLPCWLETNGDINEQIYEKFGFRAVKREAVLGKPSCGMLRCPRPCRKLL